MLRGALVTVCRVLPYVCAERSRLDTELERYKRIAQFANKSDEDNAVVKAALTEQQRQLSGAWATLSACVP